LSAAGLELRDPKRQLAGTGVDRASSACRQESANSGPPDQVSAEGSPSQIPRIAQLLARAIKFETMVVSSPQASTPANVRYDWAD